MGAPAPTAPIVDPSVPTDEASVLAFWQRQLVDFGPNTLVVPPEQEVEVEREGEGEDVPTEEGKKETVEGEGEREREAETEIPYDSEKRDEYELLHVLTRAKMELAQPSAAVRCGPLQPVEGGQERERERTGRPIGSKDLLEIASSFARSHSSRPNYRQGFPLVGHTFPYPNLAPSARLYKYMDAGS
ncbi:hypothetical protein KIPB_008423 [Kipferlia bialata]|uniref:Uncharacterized protein n=1 Tax=Kipferlia bialata TaxID=797122 RepID=A0A9K3GKQ5_9EUKA|nr:hypothetical protein KIPB_008423 [Kipferlia bialata]|eukprot:g8423.t1